MTIAKKFLAGEFMSLTPMILPLRSATSLMPAVGGRQQAHAAAVQAGDDLDVEALLHRLQPAQRHADGGVGLAGRERFQQLIGRAGIIDEIDVEPVLGEETLVLGDRDGEQAGRAGVR